MKYYYISSMNGRSGVCSYSRQFYFSVLKERGYTFIDSATDLSDIFTVVTSQDYVHIEIGVFQKREVEILFLMLRAGYKSVVITMHDPPLLKYPFKEFGNKWTDLISRFYDRFIVGFRNSLELFEKIKAVYVLSKAGVQLTRSVFQCSNIFYLPHIGFPVSNVDTSQFSRNLVYMGFIGRNKGIEYSLQLHKELLAVDDSIKFFVIGTALGKEKMFFEKLRRKYIRNVYYLGYVPEEDLSDVYKQAAIALNFFKDYRFYCPASGSVLKNMSEGKIVLTNRVNSVAELIKHGRNGFFISGNLRKDAELVRRILNDRSLMIEVMENQRSYLEEFHGVDAVKAHLRDGLALRLVDN